MRLCEINYMFTCSETLIEENHVVLHIYLCTGLHHKILPKQCPWTNTALKAGIWATQSIWSANQKSLSQADVMCKAGLFFRDYVYSLIVYQYTNILVRTETVWVNAFFKSTAESLSVMWVFYSGLLFPTFGMNTAQKSAYLYALLWHDAKASTFIEI